MASDRVRARRVAARAKASNRCEVEAAALSSSMRPCKARHCSHDRSNWVEEFRHFFGISTKQKKKKKKERAARVRAAQRLGLAPQAPESLGAAQKRHF